MKSIGVIRRIDELGRIVIPVELRRKLSLSPGDQLEFLIEGDSIRLRRGTPCVFCRSSQDLVAFRDQNVCQEWPGHPPGAAGRLVPQGSGWVRDAPAPGR